MQQQHPTTTENIQPERSYASYGTRPDLKPPDSSIAEPVQAGRPVFRGEFSSDGLASKRYANWARGRESSRV
jgi:hypothetical protein